MGEEKLLPREVHFQMLSGQEERQVPQVHVLQAPHLLIKISLFTENLSPESQGGRRLWWVEDGKGLKEVKEMM